MRLSTPEPSLVFVALSPRLVLRVLVIGDRTFAGWWLDDEPVTEPEPSAEG